MRICGQKFTPDILHRIQHTMTTDPDISRRALSIQVCQWLNWRNSNGDWQEGGARKALARLEHSKVVELPSPRISFKPRKSADITIEGIKLRSTLKALGPIEFIMIKNHRSQDAQIWRGLMQRYHYLGDKPLCGAQLRYLIRSEHHGWLGALAFNSASWALADRDKYIGWSEAARRENLHQVVCNSRFLILPEVCVPNLASHLLAAIARRLPQDWQTRYGVTPVLMETFVNPTFFDGTCYRAANWVTVGKTAGRRDGIAKDILLYPLTSKWQQQLCSATPTHLKATPRPTTPIHWTEEEFGTLPLYDNRLKQRLFTIAQDFYNSPLANIPEASGSKARTMGAYRYFQNSRITMDSILTPHIEATITRIKAHKIVLAPQDTTTLNYYHHPATSGMGPIGTKADKSTGMILHDTLAFSTEGTPLGVIDAQCWARDPDDRGKSVRRKDLPIDQKESIKWLRSYRKLAEIQSLCPETQLISVGDRESDIYELFAEAMKDPSNPKLLIRAARSRKRRVENTLLWEYISAKTSAGTLTLQLPKRGNRKAREARLEVRFSEVKLQPPKSSSHAPISLWAVHLREGVPNDGGTPIEWMLLTTVPVATFEDAVERSEWYAARWGIEVFHRTLKSGCRIKDRQLTSAKTLQACLGVDMVVAWRIYHLTMLGRETPNHPCTVFFEDVEWKALYCLHHKTTVTPDKPPSMDEVVKMVAKLGGHLGRKRDGSPGTQVMWRGMQRLSNAVEMYIIFTQPPSIDNNKSSPNDNPPSPP